MKWLRHVTCLALAFCCGCALKPAPESLTTVPEPGTFVTSTGQKLTESQVLHLALDKDFILIGEGHTNACDHAVQANFLQNLALAGQKFALGLEMLPVTAQPALDAFNARQFSAADLEEKSNWNQLWGHPYSLYLPIFQVAETYNLPVLALNIPRSLLTKIRDQGQTSLSAHERTQAPQKILAASAPQKKALHAQLKVHQNLRKPISPDQQDLDETQQSDRFFLVQAIWDSMMAEQALAWHQTLHLPIVVLAGAGHVEHGWGIEYRLRQLSPQARILAVMPVRDKNDFLAQSDPKQRAQAGEMIFYVCAVQHQSRLGMHVVFENQVIRVAEVRPDSKAARAGLIPGDILVAANKEKLTTATDLHFAAMTAARQKKPLALTVQRDHTTLTLILPLD